MSKKRNKPKEQTSHHSVGGDLNPNPSWDSHDNDAIKEHDPRYRDGADRVSRSIGKEGDETSQKERKGSVDSQHTSSDPMMFSSSKIRRYAEETRHPLSVQMGPGDAGLSVTLTDHPSTDDIYRAPIEYDFETLESDLFKMELNQAFTNVSIPHIGDVKEMTRDTLLDVLNDHPDAAAIESMLRNIIMFTSAQFYAAKSERNALLSAAVDHITDVHALTPEQVNDISDDLSYILNDGHIKHFRDSFGRSLKVPEATELGRVLTMASQLTRDSILGGNLFSDMVSLEHLVQSYSNLEKRAFYAATDIEKSYITDSATGLAASIQENPVAAAFMVNRLAFSHNASKQTIQIPMMTFAAILNENEYIAIRHANSEGPMKVLTMESSNGLSKPEVAMLQFVSTSSLLEFIFDKLGLLNHPNNSEILADITGFRLDLDRIEKAISEFVITPGTSRLSTDTAQALNSLFFMIWRRRLMLAFAESFTAVPSFSSNTLSVIRSSGLEESINHSVEPALIAMDAVRIEYFNSLRDLVTLVQPRLIRDLSSAYHTRLEHMDEADLFKYSMELNKDQQSFVSQLIKLTSHLVYTRPYNGFQDMCPLYKRVNHTWKIRELFHSEPKPLKLIKDSMIVSTSVAVNKDKVQPYVASPLPDDITVAMHADSPSKFSVFPYDIRKVKFSSSTFQSLAGTVTMDELSYLSDVMMSHNLPLPEAKNLRMLEPHKSALDMLIARIKQLDLDTPHWVAFVDPAVVIKPELRSLIAVTGGENGRDVALKELPTPWISFHKTSHHLAVYDSLFLPQADSVDSEVKLSPEVWPEAVYRYDVSAKLALRAPLLEVRTRDNDIINSLESLVADLKSTLKTVSSVASIEGITSHETD